jgi:hypothetical protein
LADTTGRKLKVFEARLGFYDTVVAVPSQAAALRAWDTRQNLFASGDASVSNDKDAVAAALDIRVSRSAGLSAHATRSSCSQKASRTCRAGRGKERLLQMPMRNRKRLRALLPTAPNLARRRLRCMNWTKGGSKRRRPSDVTRRH